jgi:hypothetical protein
MLYFDNQLLRRFLLHQKTPENELAVELIKESYLFSSSFFININFLSLIQISILSNFVFSNEKEYEITKPT